MMLAQLVVEASQQGVLLYVEDGQLKFKLKVDDFPESLKRKILQHKTELISFLEQRNLESTGITIQPIVEKNMARIPLTDTQLAIWLAVQMSPSSSKYTMSLEFVVEGSLEQELAQQSLEQLIARHEVLRTKFYIENGTPYQEIQETVAFDFEWEQESENGKLFDSQMLNVASEFRKRAFDIEKDILIRAKFIRQSKERGSLLFAIHHLIADGWSISLIMKEFIAIYNTLANQASLELPELKIQFSDVCYWQQKQKLQDNYSKGISYWRQRLEDIPLSSTLPLDRSRKGINQSGQLSHYISKEQLKQLGNYASSQRVTLFVLLQTAFALYLGRVNRETDVVIGAPDAGRDFEEVQSLVGLFLQTKVIRTQFQSNPSFQGLLNKVRTELIEDSAHKDISFEAILKDQKLSREQFVSPMFQVLMNFDAMMPFKERIQGIKFSSVQNSELENKYDLTLYVAESTEGGLDITWVYDAALFDSKSIQSHQIEFEHLLMNCLQDDQAPVLSHPWLKPMVIKPTQSLELNQNHQFVDSFLQQVEMHPDRNAIQIEDKLISYSQLNKLVNRTCSLLKNSYNLNKGDRVAIAIERSEYRVVYMLAAFKIGVVFVPISSELPLSRVEFILADAKVKLMISEKAELLSSQAVCSKVLNSEFVQSLALAEAEEPAAVSILADDVAHIVYTSGSTGVPKGVLGTYLATSNRIQWMLNKWPFANDESMANITSCAFIRSIWEILTPLCGGGKLVIFQRSVVKQIDTFANLVKSMKIDRIVTAPSFLNASLQLSSELISTINSSLKYWFVSGEPLLATLSEKALTRLPNVRFFNLYGSTEVMSDVLWCEVSAPFSKTQVAIGRSIDNVGAYVADCWGNPVPIGSIGEIVISGAAVAKGYTNSSAASGFVSNETDSVFFTGDLGRIDHDKNFECLGRKDDQVKIRGHRIEPFEIQNQLLKLPEVSAAIVIASKDKVDGSVELLAYVVAEACNEVYIRTQLQAELPNYMIPSAIMLLEKLPLKENGKVDKSALPKIKPSIASTEIIVPVTKNELKVQSIWADILKMKPEEIGTETNFFELGGHSLLIARLGADINEEYSINITIKELFELTTIKEIARLLDDLQDLNTTDSNSTEAEEYEEFSL